MMFCLGVVIRVSQKLLRRMIEEKARSESLNDLIRRNN